MIIFTIIQNVAIFFIEKKKKKQTPTILYTSHPNDLQKLHFGRRKWKLKTVSPIEISYSLDDIVANLRDEEFTRN